MEQKYLWESLTPDALAAMEAVKGLDDFFDVKADSNAAIRKVQEHYYRVFGTK
jgi:hypothetical protein